MLADIRSQKLHISHNRIIRLSTFDRTSQVMMNLLPLIIRTMKNANPTTSVQSFWRIWCGCTWKLSSAIFSTMKITSVQLCRTAKNRKWWKDTGTEKAADTGWKTYCWVGKTVCEDLWGQCQRKIVWRAFSYDEWKLCRCAGQVFRQTSAENRNCYDGTGFIPLNLLMQRETAWPKSRRTLPWKSGFLIFSCFMGTARIAGLFSWIKQGTSHRELFFCYNCNTFCNTSDDKENKTKKSTSKTALKWLEIDVK